MSSKYGLPEKEGVIISEVSKSSRAESLGIKQGMVILEVNRTPVKNIQDIKNVLKNQSGTVLLLLENKYQYFYISLPLS